jgi:hypothetical protein
MVVEVQPQTIHRKPPESLHMSLSPAADQDVVSVVVTTHHRVDVVGEHDGSQAVPAKYAIWTAGYHRQTTAQHKTRSDETRLAQAPWIAFCDDDDLLARAQLQRQRDAAGSRGPGWRLSSPTSLDEMLKPIGRQHFSGSDLNLPNPRLLGGAGVEWAMKWPKPYRAASGGAAT